MTAAYDPDVATYLALVRSSGRPRFESLTVEEARQFYRSGRDTVNLPSVAVGVVEDRTIVGRGGPIGLRHYRPVDREPGASAAILFLHGGGWVIGDLDTHDSICRHIVYRTGLPLIAVDYRLAPEHRFPAAVEDALDAHGWLIEHAARLDIDAERLILAGDSAGGCLALVMALSAAELGRPAPVAQCLFYPVTDLRGGTASYAATLEVPISAATMRWFAGHYLKADSIAGDWRASPLLAADFETLPPTFLTIAGHDPLRDEAISLADRLRASKVPVMQRDLPGQIHGYLTLGKLIAEAEQSLDEMAQWLAADLGLGRFFEPASPLAGQGGA